MDAGVVLFMIPIVAIVFGASVGLLNVWLNHRRKQQMLEQWHRERMTAMEKGLPVPDVPANLFADVDTLSALRSGISLVLVGVVVYVAIAKGIDETLAWFGLIPSAAGIANLLYAALLWRRKQVVSPNQ
jgi:Domain of unknown function (DUF6249)